MDTAKTAPGTIAGSHHPIEEERFQDTIVAPGVQGLGAVSTADRRRRVRNALAYLQAIKRGAGRWAIFCPNTDCGARTRPVVIEIHSDTDADTMAGTCRDCGRVFVGVGQLEGVGHE